MYDFGDLKKPVIGGAYSVDKFYRMECGWNWWDNEQPSPKTKAAALCGCCTTHTYPIKYEPIKVFISGIDQSMVDKTTEQWLDAIEDKLEYNRWYCGHYHTQKQIDKMEFLFGVSSIST